MAKIILRIFALCCLTLSAFGQNPVPAALQCVNTDGQPGEPSSVEPMSAEEAVRLNEAPHGAKRLGKHQLQIGWMGGNREFKDQPPYDAPLDGLSWVYCGYSPAAKFHLIGKSDKGLFTGTLLDDNTGTLLPGGEAVLFSPDQRYYIAYEQPDGQDGETLKLFKHDGSLIWKGYNGFLSPDGKSVIVDSEDMRAMRWDGQNRPQATVHLKGNRTVTVTLMRDANGKLEWLPHINAE